MNLLYKAQVRYLFRTPVKIKIPVSCSDTLFEELFQILEKVNRLYNSYTGGSYTDRLNKHSGDWVEVDEVTIELVKKVLWFSDFFEGAYDISVMPLLRLWGFYGGICDRLPDEKELEKVLTKVDYREIEIDRNKIKIAEGQELTTGSFLKSFALDCLVKEISKRGIKDVIINAGGSSIAAINFSGHPSWKVLVREPHSGNNLFSVCLSDACLCTSSQLAGAITRKGSKIGHIIDPRTGYPGKNLQVGIISGSCLIGDICSTAFCNWPAEHFCDKMQELSAFYTVSGYLITSDGEVILSGIEKQE